MMKRDSDNNDNSNECPQVSHSQACQVFDTGLKWFELHVNIDPPPLTA